MQKTELEAQVAKLQDKLAEPMEQDDACEKAPAKRRTLMKRLQDDDRLCLILTGERYVREL